MIVHTSATAISWPVSRTQPCFVRRVIWPMCSSAMCGPIRTPLAGAHRLRSPEDQLVRIPRRGGRRLRRRLRRCEHRVGGDRLAHPVVQLMTPRSPSKPSSCTAPTAMTTETIGQLAPSRSGARPAEPIGIADATPYAPIKLAPHALAGVRELECECLAVCGSQKPIVRGA
jgi:hypothetical protein